VLTLNDPTAHAEIMAIRDACRQINFFQLDNCELYTSCEPCPMCLGAIYWARISQIYYACSRKDAAMIGFDDDFIYQEIPKSLDIRTIPLEQLLRDEGLTVFGEWEAKPDKVCY
jgi:tRNA(Arg) A34 adenosine deaminase TadA